MLSQWSQFVKVSHIFIEDGVEVFLYFCSFDFLCTFVFLYFLYFCVFVFLFIYIFVFFDFVRRHWGRRLLDGRLQMCRKPDSGLLQGRGGWFQLVGVDNLLVTWFVFCIWSQWHQVCGICMYSYVEAYMAIWRKLVWDGSAGRGGRHPGGLICILYL